MKSEVKGDGKNGGVEGAAVERGFERLREERWEGRVPALASLAMRERASEGRQRARRVGIACVAVLLVGSVSYAGYRVVSRSWEASIRAEGDRVEVMLDGVMVEPENIEWFPDGTCMVTINGAKVLLDPKQPGGASASIRVEHAEDDEGE